jgi:hypothetical protein
VTGTSADEEVSLRAEHSDSLENLLAL